MIQAHSLELFSLVFSFSKTINTRGQYTSILVPRRVQIIMLMTPAARPTKRLWILYLYAHSFLSHSTNQL